MTTSPLATVPRSHVTSPADLAPPWSVETKLTLRLERVGDRHVLRRVDGPWFETTIV